MRLGSISVPDASFYSDGRGHREDRDGRSQNWGTRPVHWKFGDGSDPFRHTMRNDRTAKSSWQGTNRQGLSFHRVNHGIFVKQDSPFCFSSFCLSFTASDHVLFCIPISLSPLRSSVPRHQSRQHYCFVTCVFVSASRQVTYLFPYLYLFHQVHSVVSFIDFAYRETIVQIHRVGYL